MDAPNHRDEQTGAIAEGRRIYLGNLLYATKPNEIEQALEDHGFGNFAQIHVSIDPVSGRNPGYCFVDFNDRETAETALNSLVATVRGRPLKVGPCQPKQQGQRRDARPADRWGSSRDASASANTNANGSGDDRRWGDWKKGGDRNGGYNNSNSSNNYNNNNRDAPNGKRLYIGNLGPMVDQEQNQQEIGALLQGFAPTAIGKRITARDRESNQTYPGRNYCFVDFETAEEASQAMEALNGTPYGEEGNTLRVSIARGAPESGRLRHEYQSRGGGDRNNNGDRNNGGDGYRKRQDDGPLRSLDSTNWRRKE
ncbi:ribonucleoprotein [Sporothrix schenckii 1099-18]|uniref:RRM domain-containing protein n=2 Tax=Sporothrix schenckii TaxID=29908 RepID=U7PT44_SPOS1|nr:ribonucleoprotein [Sporothrix schenckii 1099-18]ERS98111.1 hypothetical protein HMPREF1624_04890 [Sporothrix schenckii ATCC 58251]KJR89803.1 ribonucleoprotein [Sporothrix schenckii 1099-18]